MNETEYKDFCILVADSEERVFSLLTELFCCRGIHVIRAISGPQALTMIEQNNPALVVADIHLPGINGFELLGTVRQRFPKIRCMLMTNYEVDQYISLVIEHNIGNILIKDEDFCLNEISTYIMSLIKGDIFGLQRYFPHTDIHKALVTSYGGCKNLYSQIIQSASVANPLYLEIAIDELVSNAVFHGVLQFTGVPRELWAEDFCFTTGEAISLSWASDDEKVGISVEDPRGNLKKTDVLYWLNQHRVSKDISSQEHGRGFLLIRKVIDRLIINIDPGKRTECIVFQYLDKRTIGHKKPLLVHELA